MQRDRKGQKLFRRPAFAQRPVSGHEIGDRTHWLTLRARLDGTHFALAPRRDAFPLILTRPAGAATIAVMVKVDSADATGEKVKSLGGQAMPAFDIMDQGRMAVCFDPNGAPFDVIKYVDSTDITAEPLECRLADE